MTAEAPAEVQVDPAERMRDRLWDEVWQLQYRALYVEKSAETMLNRWLSLDQIARLLLALFTSTSALAGWSLWSSPKGKGIWAVVAGCAALISIVSSTLGSQDRVKRFTETMASFVRLRLRLDCLLAKMRIDPAYDLAEVRKEFAAFQEQYVETCPSWPHDIFFTKALQNRVQAEVDAATIG